MYKVKNFVIAIYCLIEDELYPAFCPQYAAAASGGFSPRVKRQRMPDNTIKETF